MRLRLPFAFTFLIILLLASSAGLLPHSALPQTPAAARPYIPKQSDKLLHFVTFFALTAAFYFILDTTRKRVIHITLVVCTLVLAVGSEVVQGLLPNDREFDPWDVVANVLGSLAALGLASAYHKRSIERRRRAKYSTLTGEGLQDDDLELGVVQEDPPQENGVVGQHVSRTKAVEEELDTWDENQPDDWSDDGHAMGNDRVVGNAMASAADETRKKMAVD